MTLWNCFPPNYAFSGNYLQSADSLTEWGGTWSSHLTFHYLREYPPRQAMALALLGHLSDAGNSLPFKMTHPTVR